MATVPKIQAPVRQTATPQIRQSTDAPIEAFGGGQQGLFDAAEGINQHVADIQLSEKRKADDLAVTDALGRIRRVKNDLFYNPQTGAMTKKGKNAFNIVNEYGGQFDTASEDIESGLSNDAQRFAYRKIRSREKLELDTNLQKHSFKQYQVFDEETTESALQATVDDAVWNYTAPGKIQQSLQEQALLIRKHGERAGQSAKTIKGRILESGSNTHFSVIERMLVNDKDLIAKEYFEKNGDALNAEDTVKVEKLLLDGSLRGESQRLSDKILSEFNDPVTARAAVKDATRDRPKLQDATMKRINNEISIQKQRGVQLKAKNFTTAFDTLKEIKKAKGIVQVEDIPSQQWDKMDPSERRSMVLLVKQMNDPDSVEEDDTVAAKYHGMSQRALSKVSMAELIEKVHPYSNQKEFALLVDRWDDFRDAAKNPAKAIKSASILNDDELIMETLRNIPGSGVDSKDLKADVWKTDSGATLFRQVRDELNRRWMAEGDPLTGKGPTDKRKMEIADELTMTVFRPESTLNKWIPDFLRDPKTETPTFLITDEESGATIVPLDKIPDASYDIHFKFIGGAETIRTKSQIERMEAQFRLKRAGWFIRYKQIASEE